MKYLKKLNEYLDMKLSYHPKLSNNVNIIKDRFIRTFRNNINGITPYNYIFGDANNKYELHINFHSKIIKNLNAISLSFYDLDNIDKENQYQVTNKGDQIKVLNTVLNTVVDFIAEHNVDIMILPTNDPKRMRIYKILLNRLLSSTWNISNIIDIDGGLFLIANNKKNNEILDISNRKLELLKI